MEQVPSLERRGRGGVDQVGGGRDIFSDHEDESDDTEDDKDIEEDDDQETEDEEEEEDEQNSQTEKKDDPFNAIRTLTDMELEGVENPSHKIYQNPFRDLLSKKLSWMWKLRRTLV